MTLKNIPPTWQTFTAEELAPGAEKHGLSVEKERERIRIMQTDTMDWPTDLLAYMKVRPRGINFGFDHFRSGVIDWLKETPVAKVRLCRRAA